jgi:hypothetical protein
MSTAVPSQVPEIWTYRGVLTYYRDGRWIRSLLSQTRTKKTKSPEGKKENPVLNTHVSRLQGSVRDDPSPVPGLRTVGDDLLLDVTDRLVVVLGRSEEAEVVDLQESSRVE